MNKHWEHEDGTYRLYFNQFYDDELIAELQYSDNYDSWVADIDIYRYRNEEFIDLDISKVDEAKEMVIDIIEQHIIDEFEYYRDMLEKFVDNE